MVTVPKPSIPFGLTAEAVSRTLKGLVKKARISFVQKHRLKSVPPWIKQ
jgi:hypothetical protein